MNRCVCCGEEIPEGRMVCPGCEKTTESAWKKYRENEKAKYEGTIVRGGYETERWCGDLMAVVRWVETQMQREENSGCEARIHRL